MLSPLSANDPYEQLIAQMIKLESRPKLDLQSQQTRQKKVKDVLGELDGKLSALRKQLQTLGDSLAGPFATRKVTLPENAGVAVRASASAALGSHQLQVERLATADTRVSRRHEAAGTTLRAFFDAQGAQTFTLEVASPTAADPTRRTSLAVSVDPAGTTDAEILAEIAGAIQQQATAAVDAGLLAAADRPAASLVRETADAARLSLRSARTGYAGRVGFTDSAGGLLALLEVSAAATAAGTAGGQVTAVGTSDADSALNSRFTLDGLTLVRSSNEVADALDGLTLTLERPGDALLFSVGTDGEGLKQAVTGLVDKYNAALDFVRRKTQVDGSTGTRGDLAGDSAVGSLRFELRRAAAAPLAGALPGQVALLADLGLRLREDGSLELHDATRLEEAFERDPDAVQRFFAGDGGLVERLTATADRFLGSEGLIAGRRKLIDARVRRLDAQVKVWDERLAARENLLRDQFARLQEMAAGFQSQQNTINAYFYGAF